MHSSFLALGFYATLALLLSYSQQRMLNTTLQTCIDNGCLQNGTVQCKYDDTTNISKCVCYQGYMKDLCEDRDECGSGHNPCSYGVCLNTIGSFRCECLPGKTGPHCKDNVTSYQCPVGYKEQRSNCTDIDECHFSSVSPCGIGTCVNTEGSYICTCPSGWTGYRCNKRQPSTLKTTKVQTQQPLQSSDDSTVNSFSTVAQSTLFEGVITKKETKSETTMVNVSGFGTKSTSTVSGSSTSRSPHSNSQGSSLPGQDNNSANVGLIAGCVTGGILAIGAGVLVTITLHYLLVKRRKAIQPDEDTVIEVEQQTIQPDENGQCAKTGQTKPELGTRPDGGYAMRTRFSIQRLFPQ